MFQKTSPVRVLFIAQVLVSGAVGLNLTIASLSIVGITGRTALGGLAQATTILGASTLTIPISVLARRYGRKLSLQAAFMLAGLGGFFCACATWVARPSATASVALIFLGLFCLGGATVGSLAARFAAAELATDDRSSATAIAWVLWASTFGSLFGPNIFGMLAVHVARPLALSFLAVAGLCLLAALALVALPVTVVSVAPAAVAAGTSQGRARRVLLCNPIVRLTLLVAGFSHTAMICLMKMAPLKTAEITTPGIAGMIITGHLLGMYAVSPLVGHLLKRTSVWMTLGVGREFMPRPSWGWRLAVATWWFLPLGCLGLVWGGRSAWWSPPPWPAPWCLVSISLWCKASWT